MHLCDAFDEYVVNDIDRNKIKMLKNNLKVYEKSLNYVFPYMMDFLQIKPFKTEMLIICPPWGGINIAAYSHSNLDEIMLPKLSDTLSHALKFSHNILLQMPKNVSITNLIKIIAKLNINTTFSL